MKNITRVLWHTVDKAETPKLQLRIVWNEAQRNWYAGLEDRKTQAIFKIGSGGTVSLAIKDLDRKVKEYAHG